MTGPKLDDVPAMYQVRPRSFPAGEGWREVSKREFDNYGDFPGYPEVEWERRKLYAAQQPAPTIDLERYAVAIQYAIDGMCEAGGITNVKVAGKLAGLLALIDGQAPAIDLGQFRETIERLWKASHVGSEDDLSLGKLLALIDGQARLNEPFGNSEQLPPCKIEKPRKGEGE